MLKIIAWSVLGMIFLVLTFILVAPGIRIIIFKKRLKGLKKVISILEELKDKEVTLEDTIMIKDCQKLIVEEFQDAVLELDRLKDFEPTFLWGKREVASLENLKKEVREFYKEIREFEQNSESK